MTFGELFAGIGGFSLGLERAGMQCKWQVEIDPYARAVLKKHWPEVPKHDDVRTFPPDGDYSVDLICGGFPCQDISVAGKGAGLAGARSGLWHEFARIIGEIRPRYVIVENVAALLTRGMGTVLWDLSALGYDAEWHVVPASAVGAPHRRERVWIVAYAVGKRIRVCRRSTATCASGSRKSQGDKWEWVRPDACAACEGLSDADNQGESDVSVNDVAWRRVQESAGSNVSEANRAGRQQQRRTKPVPAQQFAAQCGGWWESEPNVGRVANGVPSRVDRLRCLGNAVVPQIVEIIGRAILEREGMMRA